MVCSGAHHKMCMSRYCPTGVTLNLTPSERKDSGRTEDGLLSRR